MVYEEVEIPYDKSKDEVEDYGGILEDLALTNTSSQAQEVDDLTGDRSLGVIIRNGDQEVVPFIEEKDIVGSSTVDDEERQDVGDSDEKEPSPCSVIAAGIEYFKYTYSMLLLIFSVTIVMAAIFSKQTVATSEKGIHPVLAFFIFWFLIYWLGVMEGGQGCLVGLQHIDKTLYAESHPTTLKNTTIAHQGDNMERFIVGRQFLVVLVVFVSSFLSSSFPDAEVLGLSDEFRSIFLSSGFALIFVTITIGQLVFQINAANCMLDFINHCFMLYFVTNVSLAIEFSGLLHSVYLAQIIFAKFTGKSVDSQEPSRGKCLAVFFWCRVILSTLILGYAFAVTFSALLNSKTTTWEGAPSTVSVVVFFLLMCFAGMLDGMQIALFAVVNLPEDELATHVVAQKNCKLAFRGQNLQAFLIGRQICVTVCMFVVARITTLDVKIGDGENIFDVSDGMQAFFNTGLLGAVITTIFASLAWRIVASSFPVAFLSNPLIFVFIRLCLLIEQSGLCSSAWVLARFKKELLNYKPDEAHLGGHQEAIVETQTACYVP
jgi:hypothetical protein